ncbi:MAG: hypothetical protein ABJX82_10445 [Paracoccaceae bacterium]
MEDSTPGEATDASEGEKEDVASDDGDTPACCGSVPVSDDGVPVPDEESLVVGDGVPVPREDTPAPVDDIPAVVVDDLSSSTRLLADGLSSSLAGGDIAVSTAEVM